MGIINTGFTIELVHEPYPTDEKVKKFPSIQDAQVVAYFLQIMCRKPLN